MKENEAVEELAFIKNIINESRKSFALSGKPYIFWGILIVIGLLLESFREIFSWEFYYMYFVWIVLIAVGWGYAYVEAKKNKQTRSTKTLGSKLLGSVWLACGISMTIFGFLGTISGAIKGIYVSPTLSLVLAIAYYVTGVIYDYKWLRNVSFGWWFGAVFLFFFPSQYTNLIMAFMMIGLQIIPGIILLNKVKKGSTQTA
jgi:hypothetical protein